MLSSVCKKCGTVNDGSSEFCSNCGESLMVAAVQNNTETVKSKKSKKDKAKKQKKSTEMIPENFNGGKPKYSHRPRFLTFVLLLSILSSFAVNAYLSYDMIKREPQNMVTAEEAKETEEDKQLAEQAARIEESENQRFDEGFIAYQPDINESGTKNVVLSERDAFTLLESISGDLGIEDPKSNYYCTRADSYPRQNVYSMQQKYNGYDIDGAVITIQTDEYGTLQSVNGNHQEIPDFKAEPTFSDSDIINYLKTYVKNHYQLDESQYNTRNYSKKIYEIDGSYVLGYAFDLGTRKIVIDARTLSVVKDYDLISYEMIRFDGTKNPKLDGQKQQQTISVNKKSDTECELIDTEKHIKINMPVDSDGQNLSNKGTATYNNVPFEVETLPLQADADSSQPRSHNVVTPPDKSSVDALANLQKIYDFYKMTFGLLGVRNNEPNYELPVYMNINSIGSKKFVDNAAMVGNSYMLVTTRSGSNPQYSYALDVMAHEWTHGVVYGASASPLSDVSDRTDSSGNVIYDRQNSIQLAINEGLADVFAEFAEDYNADSKLDGNGCNWMTENLRNAKSPSGSSLSDARKFIDGQTDCHYGATIISNSAYNIINGTDKDKTINADVYADILYSTFPLYTNRTDFVEFRRLVEQQGIIENSKNKITDKQLEGIIDAFDNAGIDNTYTYDLSEKAELTVYDINHKPYSNYNVKIYKGSQNQTLVYEKDSKDSVFKLPDEVCPGIYTIVFTDNDPDVSDPDATKKKISMIVNDKIAAPDPVVEYKSEEMVFTKFGSKSNQVVLCIDCSGSMDGTPMQTTKSSAVMFVNKVLELNPSTSVSVVTYSSGATTQIAASSDLNKITSQINSLYSGGSTNMYDGLSVSDGIFDYTMKNKKMLVIMSDGLPNQGPGPSQIQSLASDMRDRDVVIFSLGFFHNLDGDNLTTGISLMRSLTENEFYYNIRSTDELNDTFELLASQISGETYYQAEIACPVNVTVTYNGETLSSDPDYYNTKTSFGYLSFEEASEEDEDEDEDYEEESNKKKKHKRDSDDDEDSDDNLKKILRLKSGLDYEITITGTGKGKMNYSISYPNEEGEYTDVRTFSNIPITNKTLISTRTNEKSETVLNVDSNSDGKIDMQYSAVKNRKGKLKEKKDYLPLIRNILIGFAAFLFIIEILLMISRIKKNGKCRYCKTKIPRKTGACPSCGQPHYRIPVILGQKPVRKPQKKAAIIAKLVFTFIFAGVTAAGIVIYNSAPSVVYRHMTESNYSIAKNLYKREVKDSDISCKYLNLLTKNYLDKVQNDIETQELNKETVVSICTFITDLKLNNSSDISEEILEDFNTPEETEGTEE